MSVIIHCNFCCNRACEEGRQACPGLLQPCDDCNCSTKAEGSIQCDAKTSRDSSDTATGLFNTCHLVRPYAKRDTGQRGFTSETLKDLLQVFV